MPVDFTELEQAIKQATLDGCEEWAYPVLADAQENCPVDTGLLRSSGTVQRDDEQVIIGFGGNASRPYAEKIHEDASLFHKVGESHFLENSANAHLFSDGAELRAIVEGRIAGVL